MADSVNPPELTHSSGHYLLGKGSADPFWSQNANKSQSGGGSSAISWAESFEAGAVNAGLSSRYNGYCLEFVANAYGAAYSSPYDSASALAHAVKLNDPNKPASAPVGALMLFDLTRVGISDGHVGISLGGGSMISIESGIFCTLIAAC